MARMPGAIWKPLAADWASQPRMRAHDIFCIHTMVGGLDGTDSLFRVNNGEGYDGTESHFGVGYDGTKVQWQDILFQADANYLGNGRVISSENADTGPGFPKWTGSDVPALTPAQVEANAQIAAWVCSPAAHADCPPTWTCHREGIPLALIPDAKPGLRGIGYHRQGVPGYMVAGAEQWSTSRGKACPGDRRIAQIPQIIARAKQIRGGTPATPEPIPLGDDTVKLYIDNKGSIWKATDFTLTWVGLPESAALLGRGAAPMISVTEGELGKIRAEIQGNCDALMLNVTKAAGGDVDEAAIIAGLAPRIAEVLEGRGGATREEIAELLAGITLRAS